MLSVSTTELRKKALLLNILLYLYRSIINYLIQKHQIDTFISKSKQFKQMKFQFFKTATFIAILVLTTSCFDDNSKDLEAWKIKNDTYFQNMKDSADFQLKTIPFEYGGGNYYIKTIQEGSMGQSPGFADTVTVNYKGTTIDGNVFDATYVGTNPINNPTAKPIQLIVNRLIYGWTFNLIDMTPGEVRTIVLPQYLAYGVNQAGSIKPYSTLRFDIHLVSFKPSSQN